MRMIITIVIIHNRNEIVTNHYTLNVYIIREMWDNENVRSDNEMSHKPNRIDQVRRIR